MNTLIERLNVDLPIVQAGMGGGLSTHELAAAVAEAGGLGTIGFSSPDELRADLAAFRRMSGRPLAVNLLLPFARREHFEIASGADVVVTFWGKPVRRTDKPWIHQCGSVEEAQEAHRAGADAVIAQGIEAGGHVRGTTPALEILERTRAALPPDFPVLTAGAVAEPGDVSVRLEAGAAAVVCGTRFVLTEECGAHPDYKRRLVDGSETVLTDLFGAGWPGTHRVAPNEATERWLGHDGRAPGWMSLLHRATAPVLSRVPVRAQMRAAAAQRPNQPLLGPVAATVPGTENLIEAGALYAGQCIGRISDIRPAAEVVRELAAG